jgi:hypothetical protein
MKTLFLVAVMFTFMGQQGECSKATRETVSVDYLLQGGEEAIIQDLKIMRTESGKTAGTVSYDSNIPEIKITNAVFPVEDIEDTIRTFEDASFCQIAKVYPYQETGDVIKHTISYTLGNGDKCTASWANTSEDLPRNLLSVVAYLESVKRDITDKNLE